MPDYRRDAAVAAACGTLCLAGLAVADALGTLADRRAVALGVGGALAAEAAFVLDTPAARWWERPGVRVGAGVALLVGVAALASAVGPVLVAAACWGLATYFVLLAVVAAGYWPFDGAQ